MSNLQYRQSKIQEKRKQTPWRDFVMEICSRSPVNFYKNNGLVSVYPDVNKIRITDNHSYQEGRESLVGIPGPLKRENFIDQFNELFSSVGLPNTLSFFHNENCDYVSPSIGSKNSYLSFGVIGGCENVLYSYSVKDQSKDIVDSVMVRDNCSIVYQSSEVFRSHQIFYSHNILDSSHIIGSTNLQGCSYCINCSNLTNQSYYINNNQVSPDEYHQAQHKRLARQQMIVQNIGCHECYNCHAVLLSDHIENGIFCYQVHYGRNIGMCGSAIGNESLYDTFFFGSPSGNHIYGLAAGGSGVEYCYCSHLINGGASIFYSIYLENCSFCLGCIGLKNKSYCILNKQYTKEERYEKVDEIFSQMEKDGTLGQFFPASMNPFYFNDTAAYLIDPSFTKEEVTTAGYLWRDEPIKVDIPERMEVVESRDLDKFEKFEGEVWTIDPIILKKTIRDEKGNVYRVIKLEYDFLVKYGLPLPRKHWLTRMKENFRIH